MNLALIFPFGSHHVSTLIDDNQDPLFLADDVCKVLGYKKVSNAIRRNVYEEDALFRGTLTQGGIQQMLYINESGLYALIFGSELEEAKKFKRWVTSEVLPMIRKHGSSSAIKKNLELQKYLELERLNGISYGEQDTRVFQESRMRIGIKRVAHLRRASLRMA